VPGGAIRRSSSKRLVEAQEVLESIEASEDDIDNLFKRIGVRSGTHSVETVAAFHVQGMVAKELAKRSSRPTKL